MNFLLSKKEEFLLRWGSGIIVYEVSGIILVFGCFEYQIHVELYARGSKSSDWTRDLKKTSSPSYLLNDKCWVVLFLTPAVRQKANVGSVEAVKKDRFSRILVVNVRD